MLIKIYFNNKPLYLVDKITAELEDYQHRSDTIFIDELDPHAVRTMIYEMEQLEYYNGIFLYKDVKAVLEAFKKELILVQAAGGFVYDQEHVLLIYRRGKWDLPKGKLDKGEKLSDCAVREVKEETGLKHLEIGESLTITYHTYHEKGQHILKESHWYKIKGSIKDKITAQTEEDIHECKWVKFNGLTPYFENTHASIADVLHEGLRLIKHPA
jgi:ADP-ribose pyrophosphatase